MLNSTDRDRVEMLQHSRAENKKRFTDSTECRSQPSNSLSELKFSLKEQMATDNQGAYRDAPQPIWSCFISLSRNMFVPACAVEASSLLDGPLSIEQLSAGYLWKGSTEPGSECLEGATAGRDSDWL